MDVAAIHGHLETVKTIVRDRRRSRYSVSGLYGAIIHSHVHVVRYIYAHQPEFARWPTAEDGAGVLRRLLVPVNKSMLEFYRGEREMMLNVRDVEECIFRGDLAAIRVIPELDLVDWSAVTADLMDTVAVGGECEMVKLLCEDQKSVPSCTTLAIGGAAENGHLGIVQLLHELQKPCTRLAVDFAARNGYIQ